MGRSVGVPQRLGVVGTAVVGRFWRAGADLRRRRAGRQAERRALEAFGSRTRSARSALTEWNAVTADRHDEYRATVAPVTGSVAVVCSSNRPADLANVAEMVGRQRVDDLGLIFVAHGDDFGPELAEAALDPLRASLSSVQVLHRPTSVSLGECLNAAMGRTDARFVAKFDSDDRYGAEYLADALRAHAFAGAALVGKHSHYAYLAATDEYVLRYPGKEFHPTSTLAGSTFVIDRDLVDDQRFEPISLGEDRAFIRACHRRGLTVYAADRFNHVLVRTGENTWQLPRSAIVASSLLLTGDAESIGIER